MIRFPSAQATRRSGPAVILGLLLILSSCGVSRSAPNDAALTDDETTTDETTGDDEASDTSAPTTPTTPPVEPTPTPSTAPADEVAISADLGDGEIWELTHGELNEVVIPTWDNQEFVTLAFGGAIPAGFYPGVTYEHLVGETLERELAAAGASVEDADTDAARENLSGLMQSWFTGSADPTADADRLYEEVPYLPFVVNQQAKQNALGDALVDSGDLTVDAPCVRHILLDDEAGAQEVRDLLDGGADFAELAAERSTGPTGPTGGDLGCAPSSNYVPEFAAAVDGATLGDYVGPVQTQFGWHVLVVDRFEESQMNPGDLIGQLIRARLETATVDVDPRLGTWDPVNLTINPASDE